MFTPAIDPAVRRARIGVALLFLTNGALFANILPRYPEVKTALGLDATTYGPVATWEFRRAGSVWAGRQLAASVSLLRPSSPAEAIFTAPSKSQPMSLWSRDTGIRCDLEVGWRVFSPSRSQPMSL